MEGVVKLLNKVKNMGGSSVEICEPVFNQSDLIKEYQVPEFLYTHPWPVRGDIWSGGIGSHELWLCASGFILSCFEDFIKESINGCRVGLDSLDGVKKLSHALHTCLEMVLSRKSQQAIQTAKNYKIGKVAKKFIEDFTETLSS